MRELKSRAVVLSQENARLATHANEAAALRQRNSELESALSTAKAEAAARAEAQVRNDELVAQCEELRAEVKRLRDSATSAAKTHAAEGTRHRDELNAIREELRVATAEEAEKAAAVARAERAEEVAQLKGRLEAAASSEEQAVTSARMEWASKLQAAEKEVADCMAQ